MAGLLDSISGLLSNPAIQQLLPAVAGAAGSALTSPRGTGGRGQLGRALLGGAQGYEQGLQNQELGLQTQKLQLENKQMQQAITNQAALQKIAPTWEKDFPEVERPIFNSLITSANPKDQQRAIEMRVSQLAKPATIAQLVKADPSLDPEQLKQMPAADLHAMYIKRLDKNPSELETEMQTIQAAAPKLGRLDVLKQALALKPEAALPAALTKMQESEAATAERQDKSLAAMQERSDRAMAHSEQMERMHEDLRDHLETLKDAKTTDQRKKVFQSTITGLAKTRSQIEARANKAPDQATRQAEADTFNSGLDTLKLSVTDPEQVEQLDKLKLGVGAATPGKVLGEYWETPGKVGPASAGGPEELPPGWKRTSTGAIDEKGVPHHWEP